MREAANFCRQWNMLPEGGLVLCALSGGRDSMALAQFLWEMSAEGGFRLACAHYNHCLRETADRDENFVRSWCREKQIPLICGRGDVKGYAEERGLSLEEAAREKRYRFLEDTADSLGADRIATAHHRRDNGETVLMNLLRGTGLRGLTGIPPVRGRIIRPFLEVDREEIDAYVREKQIPYVEDETNGDPFCTRNRLRLEVLPLLEELSPGCTGRIAAAAERMRADEQYLEKRTEELLPAMEGEGVTLPLSLLHRQEEAIRRRLIRSAAEKLGVILTAAQVDGTLGLSTGGNLDLPGGLRAVRRKNTLRIEKKYALPGREPLHEGTWGRWRITITEDGESSRGLTAAMDASLRGRLSVAPWDGRGRLTVDNGSRTIKRLFADRRIPVEKRLGWPVLLLGDTPAAVPGVAADRLLAAKPGEPGFVVHFEEEHKP